MSPLLTLERDTYEFWAEFAHRPGGARGVAGGATWFRSGVPFVNYNGVVGADCDVGDMLARVRAWDTPARWIVSSASSDGFDAAFEESGLTLMDEAPGMVARIADLPKPHSEELEVEVVTGDRLWLEWQDVFRDAFGFSPAVAEHVSQAHKWPCLLERGRTYLLMRHQGAAVATGLLHSSVGIAGVYAIGVRRACRRRGWGALATLLTVREGERRGATEAVLQATSEGFPVYAKLGFQTLCSFRSWRIA
jgi:hypothetical protein